MIGVAGLCTKLFMSKLGDFREIMEQEMKPISHKMANASMRIDGLDKKVDDNDNRLVRLEMAVGNIEKGQQRIETEVRDAREKIETRLDRKFDQLSASIREIREVSPLARPPLNRH